MENGNPNKINTVRSIAILLLVLACIIFLVYRYRTSIYGEMNALKLVPTPERFTELYFTDPAAIPTSTIAGQPISFAFTIHNMEGATTSYPYSVYFESSNSGTISLARGMVSLSDNASTSIPVSYTFPTFPTSTEDTSIIGEVVVALPTLNDQQIDFLLPYNN